ncbi:hypothetical protein [Parasutterella secunda]|uniref:Uncharacterized protein n=1 Tax=Parasutterella secunda TaxID=626947 RepID=A0ABS2GRX6_9BURK|nr:hypothetical protein [Parasutterella secunda]MBM6928603.1 hypothetical protein [Parasutterella secunda]
MGIYNYRECNFLENFQMLRFYRNVLSIYKDGIPKDPDIDDLLLLNSKIGGHLHKVGRKDLICSIEAQAGDRFWFWFIKAGLTFPLAETIAVESPEGEVLEEQNPRTANETELRNQVFCLYDMKKREFYISDFQKRRAIIELFNETTKTNGITWELSNVYKSPEEFESIIQKVGQISFTAKPTLFNSDFFKISAVDEMADLKSFQLKLVFDSPKKRGFLKGLKSLEEAYFQNSLDNLICSGVGDQAIEKVFNPTQFNERISVLVEKSADRGLFDPNVVKNELIKRILELDDAGRQ